jgi:hypothetical protein
MADAGCVLSPKVYDLRQKFKVLVLRFTASKVSVFRSKKFKFPLKEVQVSAKVLRFSVCALRLRRSSFTDFRVYARLRFLKSTIAGCSSKKYSVLIASLEGNLVERCFTPSASSPNRCCVHNLVITLFHQALSSFHRNGFRH